MTALRTTSKSRKIPLAVLWLSITTGFVTDGMIQAGELAPVRLVDSASIVAAPRGWYSQRSLSLAIEVDRDGARVIAYTLKSYPFIRPINLPDPLPSSDRGSQSIEVVMLGPAGLSLTQRLEVGPLCFEHPAGTPPHIQGDRFTAHGDNFVIEVPEIAGLNRVQVARYEKGEGTLHRKLLADEALDGKKFTAAGGAVRYADLAFAPADAGVEPLNPGGTTGVVIWPESVGLPDIYRLLRGDLAESDRRVKLVIVPDGYRVSDKALMDQNANSLANYLFFTTPFWEHIPFFNIILVYAYSLDSGVDECDCEIVKDTAMGLRFPEEYPLCGDFDNRCLNYGNGGCDTVSSGNIALAEQRVPGFDASQGDKTILMANTTRDGGCGGTRSVYAARTPRSLEVALHELGHTMAGLADEYGGNPSCGHQSSEINTSRKPDGAWPEWLADLGDPVEGADYYDLCTYRPIDICKMRSTSFPFCPVCLQRWSLTFFGTPRVAPTAPVESMSPASPRATVTDVLNRFQVGTRLSPFGVTNDFTWEIQGPGFPTPTVVDSGSDAHSQVFAAAGEYTLTCRVTADTNFVKPAKNGANLDVATWTVDVTFLPPALPFEVSPPAALQPLVFQDSTTLQWEDASVNHAASFNLYRGSVAGLHSGDYGACQQAGVMDMSTADAGVPQPQEAWFYLVTARNSVGEGTLGVTSSGATRTNATSCP
jgi:hypothetical protein